MHSVELPGRAAELDAIGRLLTDGGPGLGWHGPLGIGRTTLLEHATRSAESSGVRVLRVAGSVAERRFPFGGVHQIVHALRGALELMPEHPRAALEQVLGGARDVATAQAMVMLLDVASRDTPVLLAVDDADLLDRPSAEVLGFVVRRCGALNVSVIATAGSRQDWPIPWSELSLLSEVDARRLLAGLDAQVRRRVLRESAGLPLAVVEYAAAAQGNKLPVSDRLAAMFTDLTRELSPSAGLAAAFGLRRPDAACAAVLHHPLGRAAIIHTAARTVSGDLWQAAASATEDADLAATAWIHAAELATTEADKRHRQLRAASCAWQAGRLDDAISLGGPVRQAYLAHLDGDLDGLADVTGEVGLTLLTGRKRPPDPSPIGRLFSSAARAVECGLRADERLDLLAVTRADKSRLHTMIATLTLAIDRLDAGAAAEAESWARQSIGLAEMCQYRALAALGRAVLAVSAAIRGQGQRAVELSDTVLRHGCEGTAAGIARHARVLVALGRGDYDQAYAQASQIQPNGLLAGRVLLDVVLACVHTDRMREAEAWIAAVVGKGQPALLAEAGAALLADDPRPLFEAALACPSAARRPLDLARIRLKYGEWLRRRTHETAAARHQLCLALDVLERAGARPWADRARDELRASGISQLGAAARPAGLTEQEHRIARLAAAGLTNKQIGVRLFLSPRTVGAHLYKAFPKLGISSRGELREALADEFERRQGA